MLFSFLIGFPIDFDYYGFVPFEPVQGWFSSLSKTHNSIIGKFSKYAPEVVGRSKITKLSVQDINQYIWAIVPVGVIQSLALYGLAEWKDKHFKTGIGSIGELFLKSILTLILKPINFALHYPWQPKDSFIATSLAFGFLFYLSTFEPALLRSVPRHHPYLVSLYMVFTLGIFYALGMVVITVKSFAGRIALVNLFVPIFDFVMSPIYWLLSIDMFSKSKKVDLSLRVPIGRDMKTGKPVVLTEKTLTTTRK